MGPLPSEVSSGYIQGRDLPGCSHAPEHSPYPCQQRTKERGDSSDHVPLLSSNRSVPCPLQSHWLLVVVVRTSMRKADLITLVKINNFFS